VRTHPTNYDVRIDYEVMLREGGQGSTYHEEPGMLGYTMEVKIGDTLARVGIAPDMPHRRTLSDIGYLR
jgi:hypothetical protein